MTPRLSAVVQAVSQYQYDRTFKPDLEWISLKFQFTPDLDQATDIFLGKSAHFPDGSPAIPIDQAEGTAAREEFYRTFADKSAAQLKAHWSTIIFTGRGQPPKAVSNSDATKKLLAENHNAIAYIERNLVDSTVKVLAQP